MRLFDGQHHSVDSSEMAFKIAGSMAFKQAVGEADPYLLEPIMLMTIAVPEDAVGDVIGDLNSRRGRPLGMEPKGTATEIKAEVPMAEVLDYAPDLRAITGGRGDYTMVFEHYEEVPGHIAQKVVAEAEAADEQGVGPSRRRSRRASPQEGLGAWAAAQSRRRSENSTVPGPTSTTLSAGTSARRAASTIASGEGADQAQGLVQVGGREQRAAGAQRRDDHPGHHDVAVAGIELVGQFVRG